MGGNHNTVNIAGYRHDVRVALYALDNFGVGIDGKHLVPAVPKFLEHGIGSNVRVARNACYHKVFSFKESRYWFRDPCHRIFTLSNNTYFAAVYMARM